MRKFPRNKDGINDQFQLDLADVQALASHNEEFKYIFTCICVFSKYAWAVPVKNKTGAEMVRAFRIIMKERKPNKVQSYERMDFRNIIFQSLLKEQNIQFFTSKNRDIKAAVIERFNRTLKTKLWKPFFKTRSYKYIDILHNVIYGYNHSYHRSLKMAPVGLNEGKKSIVREHLYGSKKVHAMFKLKVVDSVRVSKIKDTFAKGYLPSWSEEIFTVHERLLQQPVMYRLSNYNNEPIEGLLYEQELQAAEQEKFWIYKVIKRRKQMALVKWTGYPETSTS